MSTLFDDIKAVLLKHQMTCDSVVTVAKEITIQGVRKIDAPSIGEQVRNEYHALRYVPADSVTWAATRGAKLMHRRVLDKLRELSYAPDGDPCRAIASLDPQPASGSEGQK